MNGRAPHLDSKIESEKINRIQCHGEQHPVHKHEGAEGYVQCERTTEKLKHINRNNYPNY